MKNSSIYRPYIQNQTVKLLNFQHNLDSQKYDKTNKLSGLRETTVKSQLIIDTHSNQSFGVLQSQKKRGSSNPFNLTSTQSGLNTIKDFKSYFDFTKILRKQFKENNQSIQNPVQILEFYDNLPICKQISLTKAQEQYNLPQKRYFLISATPIVYAFFLPQVGIASKSCGYEPLYLLHDNENE